IQPYASKRVPDVAEDSRRRLPAVGSVLTHELLAESLHRRGRLAVRRAVRSAIEELRQDLETGQPASADPLAIAQRSIERLETDQTSLREVINATGVILHTGLGRAPLARHAVAAVVLAGSGYCNLELELDEGKRGRRTARISELLQAVTGAEAATVVNNNAGATVLALRAL